MITMERKLPKLCGTRPIDALPQITHGMNTQDPVMSLKEVLAAICYPPCTCADFEQGFYTANEQMQPGWFYRRSLSNDEAKQIAASYINNMQQDRKYLTERLTLCGDIVLRRWKKKSQDKRQSLLLEVIPNICEKRWIILRLGFTPEGKQIPPINSNGEMEARSPDTRHHLLLQWFSLEVLKTNPAVLFALLHNRTVYSPQDWASFDARQLNISFPCGYFDFDFSAECVMMQGLRYGEVVDWKDCLAHRADILGFPKARLVLEAQAYLMSSLRKIVDGILQGFDTNASPAAEKWNSMVLMGFRHTNVVKLWSPYTNQLKHD
ncbi:47be4bfb-565e-42b9-9ca9-fb9789dd0b6c [Sclerotinia trifoliorum]|uniref:47be4bfb-565e-42b9-9ca9-fb9789dd0b6c n=1 Tax=Sclerotinia trifoliorum TaxID=28548 RepID=A0A8H2W212_9HELO|nr:47be4bfb-565e-42b9-9ca9-fb9789dd0b6c [Sclerotinia trifoliorum]